MKKVIYTLAFAAFSMVSVFGQNNAIKTYFSDYLDREDVTTIMVSGKAFEMAQEINIDGEEGEQFKEMASQITGFTMIIEEDVSNALSKAKTARKKVKGSFEQLIEIKEKENNVVVLVEESNGVVYEVLCIVGTNDEFILASLTGDMRLSDVSEMTKSFSSMGKNMFAESSVDPSSLKLYPSPVNAGTDVNMEIPESLVGGTIRVFDSSGSEVQNFRAKNKLESIDTSRLSTGVYVLKGVNNGLEITTKFIVQ